MKSAQSQQEILLSLNLTVFSQSQGIILPIIAECGGHEIGSAGQIHVFGFAANGEGVVTAVNCAQRLQLKLPQGSNLVIAIHVGDIQGEGLKTLLAIGKVTGPGGISMSQPIVELGEGRLPIALEPLDTAQGPTGFFTMVRTRFIEMPAKGAGSSTEKTNTKMIYAQTSLKTSGTLTKQKATSSDDRTLGSRIGELLQQSKSNFGIMGGGLLILAVTLVNLTKTQNVFERGKAIILSSAVGRTLAEKASNAEASMKASGAELTKPIDLAKKAAEQASAVPNELLELAPEIKREDVMGKAKTVAAAPDSAPRPDAGATPSAEVAGTAAPGAAPNDGAVAVAKPLAESTMQNSPIEETLFSKCQTDAEFCHTSALIFLKDNAPASALRFFKHGCELNYAKSCTQASAMYQYGQGVARSDTMAKSLLAKGCSLNDGAACTEVGLAYLQGLGVPVSLTKAREAIDRGCALGHGPACLVLGLSAHPPADAAARAPASSAESLAKGCALLNITPCAAPTGGQKH